MESRIFSDSVQNDVDRISMVVAANGDVLTFARSARYTATGLASHVVTLRSNTLSIYGELYSGAGATVFSNLATATNTIRVADGGIISSAGGSAIQVGGTSLSLTNAGDISGTNAVASTAKSSTIVNSGAIFGFSFGISTDGLSSLISNSGQVGAGFIGIYVSALSGTTQDIFNTGAVTAGAAAIQVIARGAIHITNAGTLTGAAGINLFSYAGAEADERSIVNTGTIQASGAAIAGSLLADTVQNDGTIHGAVLLNAGNDVFDGSRGVTNGRVAGGDGDDLLTGSEATRSVLDGGAGNDILAGGDKNDVLIPGTGNDIVDGGGGIDVLSFRDRADGVRALLDVDGNLVNGTRITSIEGLEGGSGNDYLAGLANNNLLIGNAGDDTLFGGSGDDRMIGGTGNDVYSVSDEGDLVIEHAGEGTDTVEASTSFYVLPDYVENLVLGNYDERGFGNDGANVIRGGAGDDFIDGRGGNDTLYGGTGVDEFVFTTPPGPSSADTIMDFTSDDRIGLSLSGFPAISSFSVVSNAFRVGAAAGDADDRLIYNPTTHVLYYDADGTGSLAQVQLATFAGTSIAPTASSFEIFL